MRTFAPLLAVAALLTGSPPPLVGGNTSYRNPNGYRFYEVWWRPYRSDRQTALLLPFGTPGRPAWARFGNAAVEAEQEKDPDTQADALFGDAFAETPGMSGDGLGGGQMLEAHLQERAERAGRDPTERSPDGILYDYSPNRNNLELPQGAEVVPDGRFGSALRITGRHGITAHILNKSPDHRRSMEGWFRMEALPEAKVCLFASGTGEKATRLHLHPDGRLELTWFMEETGRLETIATEAPAIRAGAWTHVAAYTFLDKHIEYVFKRAPRHEIRIGVNGRPVARFKHPSGRSPGGLPRQPLVHRGLFYLGMNPEGEAVYRGRVDEVRVSGMRRYLPPPEPLAWRDPAGEREVTFGPPDFQSDSRLVHASFQAPRLTVHPEGKPALTWDPAPHATFENMQFPGPYGKALLIDPALGFPRIPIDGLSLREGTFEMWIQPVNWDNHTDFGKINWSEHTMSVARFRGRDTRSGKHVTFMEVTMARAAIHGEKAWIHPGAWRHLVWTWSPEDVLEEDGWGDSKKGDPVTTFRAYHFGNQLWRVQLNRRIELIGHIEPRYLELGIADAITVREGERPAILVDEVIAHDRAYSEAERDAAPER